MPENGHWFSQLWPGPGLSTRRGDQFHPKPTSMSLLALPVRPQDQHGREVAEVKVGLNLSSLKDIGAMTFAEIK